MALKDLINFERTYVRGFQLMRLLRKYIFVRFIRQSRTSFAYLGLMSVVFANWKINLKSGLVIIIFISGMAVARPAWATVQINEIMPNPSGDGKEWVELYNDGGGSVDLTGWTLTNKDGVVKMLGGSISDYKAYDSDTELLKNSGDSIVLKDNHGDQQGYGFAYGSDPGQGVTLGRWPDGASGWLTMESATKESANSGPEPTATPTPENTPTPSATPTPEVLPTEILKATPTKKATSPTPTKSAPQSDEPSDVDQLRDQISGNTAQVEGNNTGENATQAAEAGNDKSGGIDWLILGLIGGGVIFLGGAGLMVWKGRKTKF
jgi:hypothetical protein